MFHKEFLCTRLSKYRQKILLCYLMHERRSKSVKEKSSSHCQGYVICCYDNWMQCLDCGYPAYIRFCLQGASKSTWEKFPSPLNASFSKAEAVWKMGKLNLTWQQHKDSRYESIMEMCPKSLPSNDWIVKHAPAHISLRNILWIFFFCNNDLVRFNLVYCGLF